MKSEKNIYIYNIIQNLKYQFEQKNKIDCTKIPPNDFYMLIFLMIFMEFKSPIISFGCLTFVFYLRIDPLLYKKY